MTVHLEFLNFVHINEDVPILSVKFENNLKWLKIILSFAIKFIGML